MLLSSFVPRKTHDSSKLLKCTRSCHFLCVSKAVKDHSGGGGATGPEATLAFYLIALPQLETKAAKQESLSRAETAISLLLPNPEFSRRLGTM